MDFDYEYPGEADILGIPSGSDQNGNDYSIPRGSAKEASEQEYLGGRTCFLLVFEGLPSCQYGLLCRLLGIHDYDLHAK